MRKVRLIVDPELEKLFPACRPCEISVFRKDGSVRKAENRFRKGDPENPMDRRAISGKFDELTEGVLGREQREGVLEWVYGLERMRTFSWFRWN
jgi:2-methylcitrate dehydratase PrpD